MPVAYPSLPALLLTILLAFPGSFSAQTAADNAITNADIVRMVRAGIPDGVIVREIQMSKSNLDMSPAALIELKNQGASERILGAVLDSRGGSGTSGAELRPAPRMSAQSGEPASHHLPSFEAKVRLKSNDSAKITMTQNHIKVEKSGVPLFDLKWKEKAPR